ncbi:MAG: metallophosphoesterase [Acidimicrobiia bacterium]|nr:MAG: metallophosphoesterase [Acidimicrobiia bacterium]
MLIVSDVHGAFDALAEVAASGEVLLILGDLLNLVDYRTGEGMTAEVLGIDFARETAKARAAGDYALMRRLWREKVADRIEETAEAFEAAARRQYQEVAEALGDCPAYVTYGNVDRPHLLRELLPPTARFVDGEVVEIEGFRIGFVGGGISTPLGAAGEVSDRDMEAKLAGLGKVDVLCSHLPPAVPPLHRDVVTGRLERASRPILDYLLDTQPRYHFFGDVHQPQALCWRVGRTRCRNVGYFRATKRPVRFP